MAMDGSEEQWILWYDLAAETEWVMAELIAFSALPLAAEPPEETIRLVPPAPPSLADAVRERSRRAWTSVARRLERILGLCEDEIEVIRRRLVAHVGT
jgi:hypothetical protein